ncbi:DUF7848 domain-containing protein [Streptomyces purpureus]|uniref:DUF7848 domain-containing protein n=1 Tax=Streptomyces purpureus TaxID=1951 RepID=A0A918HIF4_9ACTN|nr:hypothetical protein GCM10014713_69370 [Streptomyces purpureus]
MGTIRAAYRHVLHRIIQHPDTDITHEAQCLSCAWEASPSTDAAAVDVECMSHTGRSNHRSFRRVCTSFTFVVRDEPRETPGMPRDGEEHSRPREGSATTA